MTSAIRSQSAVMHELSDIKKLKWACRRGMLELDVILERFVERHYAHSTDKIKAQFQALLHCQDTELYTWLIKHEAADEAYSEIIDLLLADED